jgi:ribosomal protein S18 acetylase RimI-like enzyme
MHQITSKQISLKPAEATDDAFLYQVYASTRQEELARVPWTALQKRVFLRTQHQAQLRHYRTYYPNATFELICQDDEPIGRLFIKRGVEEVRLMDIALLPAYRNQGIGTRLMHNLLEEAEALGQFIGLHVEQFNPAYQLYQRLGFRDVELRGIYMYMTWNQPESQLIEAQELAIHA